MLVNAKRPKPDTKNRKKSTKTVLPPLWRLDSRPDPTAMSEADRSKEFGRVLFRAIERRRAKSSD